MNLFITGAAAMLAGMGGFWLGRAVVWKDYEETEEDSATEENPETEENSRNRKRTGCRRGPLRFRGQEIVAPASGQLRLEEEENNLIISCFPENGRVFSPAEGRIQRLAPMGSKMLLKTENGIELILQAGRQIDEMHSECYRCRIMEHEYVRKGTLLLEYDTAAIRSAGADPVLRMLLSKEQLEVSFLRREGYVKALEPVLCVQGGDCEKQMALYERNF